MGKVRKATVAITMIILVLYFTAGLFGLLPYNYDFVKKAVVESGQSTALTTVVSDWKLLYGLAGMSDARDSIVFEDNLYVIASQPSSFKIYKIGSSPIEKYYQYGYSNINFAKFVEYKDSDAEPVLYAVISGGSATYPYIEFHGTYDGDTWHTHTDNSKFLPEITNRHADSICKNGRFLYVGYDRQDVINIARWDAVDWGTGWDVIYSGSWAKVTAMVAFQAPLPSTYTTVWFALEGNNYLLDYAGIYYFDQSNHGHAVIYFNSTYEIEMSALTIYKSSLFFGTGRGTLYNYSRTTNYLYQYTSPVPSPLQRVECFGIYNDYLYMGAGASAGDGDIYKMTQKTYNKDSWQKVYETSEASMFSFSVFNSKFYATSGDTQGKVFVYDETVVYTNPSIQHNPISEGLINVPTRIIARVSDIDGIDSVTLTYQVEGRLVNSKAMGLQTGSGQWQNGKYVNGTYSADIPEQTDPCNISYYISAIDRDGNQTVTLIYIIHILREKQILWFGIDFRVLYLLGIGLTLAIGYAAYGKKDEKESSRKGKWHRG